MSSVDEFSAAVGSAAASAESVITAIGAAKSNGDELASAIDSLDADAAAARVRAVGGRLESEAAAMALRLKDLLDELRQQAQGVGEALTRVSGGGSLLAARNTPPPFDARPVLASLPVFERKRGSTPRTHGEMRYPDGTRTRFASGEDATTPRIREHMWEHTGPVRSPQGFWSESHAELKAALAMSDHRVKRADIVINNPGGPCEGRIGCDGLLARYLQPGSVLTVHWPGGDGSTRSKRYTGTRR
ncbi:DddA-like double-stranded DNA deaminase toxin [Glycomyces paridis]|uniref:Nucleic acid/nucleotide deaminase of polymorphic system toxin n=1 Tax=Glycomyces paridis TaxID=2126555 RepID=A0A4S8P6V6_9ACTN|nr:DddA-like double-stranded DNA deaminase toxin [Glycomyces paridis]THV23554.1 hypothetical protein E9998_22410 [Glycomyces paridis]